MSRDDQNKTPDLSPADIAAVDHLAEDGFDAARIDGLDGDARARAKATHALLGRLDVYPEGELNDEDRATLVHATMARINREESARQDRMRLQPAEAAGRSGRLKFRLAEFGAVAAVAAMVAGAALPIARMAKDRAVSAGTHRNLSQLHAGVANWSKDNEGRLPTKEASTGVTGLKGMPSDAQQLDVHGLARSGHCDDACLRNPRRPGIGRHGFSFVILPVNGSQLGGSGMVLIGDRNPALQGLMDGKPFLEAIEERRFARRITDHPAVLFGDGNVQDAREGLVAGDHVWDVDQAHAGQDLLLAH
ncbi:MAG: hypothetical protein MK101_00320 [Phycisphaerales bacterium]|nr:hypothetical protein [Phycisphaerales bacterium]